MRRSADKPLVWLQQSYGLGGELTSHTTTDYDSQGFEERTEDLITGVVRTVDTDASMNETLHYDASPLAWIATTTSEAASGYEASRATVVNGSGGSLTLGRDVLSRDADGAITAATLDLAGSAELEADASYGENELLERQWGDGFDAGANSTDAYGYDEGNGLKVSEELLLSYGSDVSNGYDYDEQERLVDAQIAATSSHHTYVDGRLATIEATTGGTTLTTTYAYDAASGLLASMTQGTQVTLYGWDTALRAQQGPSADPDQVTFGYDELGRLTSYADAAAGKQSGYSYNGGQLAERTTMDGAVEVRDEYVFDDGYLLRVDSFRDDALAWRTGFLYGEDDRLYAGVYESGSSGGAVPFAVIQNDRGDVLELLDKEGVAFASYRYDAWGNVLSADSRGTTSVSASIAGQIATRQPLRFASCPLDSISGCYWIGARCYDPLTRQYLQALAGDATYQEQNPAWGIDLRGITFEQPSGSPGQVVGGGAPSNPQPVSKVGIGPLINVYPPWVPAGAEYRFWKIDKWITGGEKKPDHPVSMIFSSKDFLTRAQVCRILRERKGVFGFKFEGSNAGMRVQEPGMSESEWVSHEGIKSTKFFDDPQDNSYMHIRIYAPVRGRNTCYFYRKKTAKHSQLYWVVATAHIDANESSNGWKQTLAGTGVPIPSNIGKGHDGNAWDGMKYGGNSEWVEDKICQLWHKLGDAYDVKSTRKIYCENENYGFSWWDPHKWRKSAARPPRWLHGIQFTWERSDGYAAELRIP